MASSDWYLTHPEWAIPGKAPIMSVPYVTILDMDLNLERLIASHDTPGDTYPDLLAVTAYQLTTRPGDIDRTATAIDALVTEISRCRAFGTRADTTIAPSAATGADLSHETASPRVVRPPGRYPSIR